MTNLDKIRAMSAEELGDLLGKAINQCSLCIYQDIPECSGNCKRGITRWLNAKFEKPMPDLQLGDIVDAKSGLSYVAISPMTLVCRDERKQCNLEDIINIVIRIQRYDGERYQAIWRADNEEH